MPFSKFTLRGRELRNRLVMAPMATFSSNEDGTVHPEELAYLRRRAAGGLGMVIGGACGVHRTGRAFDGQWMASEDRFLDSLSAGADAIHEGGAVAVLQIHHGGRQCPSRLTGSKPWSASAVPCAKPEDGDAHPMSVAEVHEIVAAFASAAALAERAGWDGVEIHGANGYLLQQFVSPATNLREDEYGRNRLKISLEIVDAVRSSVGDGFIVGYRFSPEEQAPAGLSIQDTERLVEALVLKDVDYLHVSNQDFRHASIKGAFPEPILRKMADVIARRKPTIGVGSVQQKADAEAVLGLGMDLVALGRTLLVEPEWPSLVQAGGSPRTKFPKEDAEAKLTLPKPLAQKMRTVPGWVELED